MVSETTSFKKGKGKKGYFMKRQNSCCSSENPRLNPNPRLSASVMRERTLEQNHPRYLVDKKAGKVDRSILDIHYINVYSTSTPSSTMVIDTGSVAKCR